MSLVTVTSAKGSPGVTTICLQLAIRVADAVGSMAPSGPAAPSHVVLAECDPSGGDLAARLGLSPLPGLASFALASRHLARAPGVIEHCTRLRTHPGVHVLSGVAGPQQGAALASLSDRLPSSLSEIEGITIVDVGRRVPGDRLQQHLLSQAPLRLLVGRVDAGSVVHLRAAAEVARGQSIALELLAVGRDPYPPRDVARLLDVPLFGTVPLAPDATWTRREDNVLLYEATKQSSTWRRRRKGGKPDESIRQIAIDLISRLSASQPDRAATVIAAPI